MQPKFLFSAAVIGSVFFVNACSHHEVVFTATLEKDKYCEAVVEEVSSVQTFDGITWDASKPLWRAKLNVGDDSAHDSPTRSFVVVYQTLPPFGQFQTGQVVQIVKYECDQLLSAKSSGILDWGTSWRERPGKGGDDVGAQ